MENLVVKEVNLIEKKDLREQCMERIEVLDKVKKLFLIPNMDVMTINMVADYFEVGIEAIKSCYHRNKDEIDEDGVTIKSYKEFSKFQDATLKTFKGKAIIELNNNITLKIPTRGALVFSKRAILRISMLLRDSEVAKEIRTQLLNTFEQTTIEQKTISIDEEQSLISEIGKAFLYGTKEELVEAFNNAFAFKNRYITKIETANTELTNLNVALKEDNSIMSGKILKWTDRACLNKAIRILAAKTFRHYGSLFTELYDELRYNWNIGLSQRGASPLIQHIREDEWNITIQVFSCMCVQYGHSPSKILERARISDKKLFVENREELTIV